MKQKNNHARSKQKRKALRLKNMQVSIFEKRVKKKMESFKAKGKTFRCDAIDIAVHVDTKFFRHGNRRDRTLNQRQRRKLAAQTR